MSSRKFSQIFSEFSRALGNEAWRDCLVGVEKESLRVDRSGGLARSQHPIQLGAPLTHDYLKTDFSESQLEFITPPSSTSASAIDFLTSAHKYVLQALKDQWLWPLSMPCVAHSEAQIPLARYGKSHQGRFQTLYRQGLGLRYGRRMQLISGVHFNLSFGNEFWRQYQAVKGTNLPLARLKNDGYMALLRNFCRYAWVTMYLFGASPIMCRSFFEDQHKRIPRTLKKLGKHSVYGPYATSLRMSDLGYQNPAKQSFRVSLDSLGEYCEDLTRLVTTPNLNFTQLGVFDREGSRQQINDCILQTEAELYTVIRPKPAPSALRPLAALQRDGIGYLEFRCLDLQPQAPVGIDSLVGLFMPLLAIYCLVIDSPAILPGEHDLLSVLQKKIAYRGREPGVKFVFDGVSRPLIDVLSELFDALEPIAVCLDQAHGSDAYASALERLRGRVEDSSTTPSAKMLRDVQDSGFSYIDYGLSLAQTYTEYFDALWLPNGKYLTVFDRATEASKTKQQQLLALSELSSFEDYLAAYQKQLELSLS